MHRLTSVTDPEGGVTTYGYDERGNQSEVTDALGYSWNYAYDKDDRLTLTTDPLEQTTGYTYDAVNRVTAYRDKMGLTESYLYDAHGNVLEKTATDGRVTDYTYDAKNRLTSVTDPMGSVAYYTYDVMDRVTGVTDYLGRGTVFTYDREGNLTSVTDAAGRKEVCTYDIAGRITSYTSNGGNRISYDYDKLDDLVEKSYSDSTGEQSAEGVTYAYNALGERVAMQDTTGDTEYTYDGLRRITSVTTYRAPGEDGFSHEGAKGDTIGYTYDEADHLAAITYADGTKVSYEYDKNDNLIKVTDREGKVTTYTYDAINRVTRIHRPNGISTYNTYNARNQLVELKNVCDTCEWVVSDYLYTYDDRGFIAGETAIESLAGYAYDDKHNGRHDDGRHDDLYPHGNRHNGKHDKDATFAYQIVETDRTFTYDAAGKLLTATETEDNYGTYVYTFKYDLMGNRTYMEKTLNGTVVEWHRYEYNESNQLISEKLYNGRKTTNLAYTYDADGNRISETGRIGTDKVNRTYEYTVENRLAAVHDGEELLLAAAYDGDGNRVFLLNYNLHTDDDWKGNSGNGNGNHKDNSDSGNNGKGNSGNNGKGNGNNKKNSKSDGTDDAGYGNATNAEENNSQNQCGILFPVQEEVSAVEADLISRIKTTGKEKNYELIEYLNDVNREHAEVLVEQNINGKTDTSYIYGAEIYGGFDRISLDRFDGSTGYYLYDARGSVSGITNEEGQVYQSYRYSVTGEITFGAPQYENEYTYNGESYNPNIQSQYLRARYYCVVTATFLTEDSYLGNQTEPLTLNRYNYCVSSYLNYTDPSGNSFENASDKILAGYRKIDSLGHELIIAVNSFSSGVSGSISKSNMDKMAGVIAVGEMLERMFGIRVRSGKPAYEQYTDLTETLVQKLSKDATNRTMYYAGRCAGDALVMATGAMEIAEGLNSFFSGIGGTVVADASGVACGASVATIAITLDGVVTIVDGAYTIYNGVVAIQGDSRQHRDAKGADRKASGGGTNVGNISEKLDTNNIHNMTKQDIIDSIPDDWTYTDNNGFVHIRDADGNMRIRIDPSDKVTNYPHVHVYDDAGNLLDSAGNIVDRKSPAGHIPYKAD